jgi:hypothetical protein
MKLRLDLAKAFLPGDVLKLAEANSHRYSAKPVFSKTGAGKLSPTSTADSAKEGKLSAGLIQKVTRRVRKSGSTSKKKS